MNKTPLVLESLKYVAASAHFGHGCGIRHLCVLLQAWGREKIIYFHALRSRRDLAAGSVYPTARVCLVADEVGPDLLHQRYEGWKSLMFHFEALTSQFKLCINNLRSANIHG